LLKLGQTTSDATGRLGKSADEQRTVVYNKSSRSRGRTRQHARRARYPCDRPIVDLIYSTKLGKLR